MPAVFLDRLPLPSLQAYTVGSVLLLACSVHYAIQVTSQIGLNFNGTEVGFGSDNNAVLHRNSTPGVLPDVSFGDLLLERFIFRRAVEVVYFMLQEPMCIWTLINMTYCCFILIGKIIQKLVFGDLRVSEQQHIKDKFWNFVFYKFIFIFGVMNVQFMDEVVLWCSWFSILGFLHLLAQLCKDRCEYLSFSPATPKWTHCRVLMLLFGILMMSFSLFGICIFVGLHAGINTFAFMAAECSLVSVRTLYVITRYAIYLLDATHEGAWEKRASYVYYTELGFELAALVVDFFHHLHMLIWGNIFLSMASLVIAMQLRCLFYEIKHRLKKYKNYLKIVKHMECNYPMATAEELEKNNDACAICWDHLDLARKLPCGHLFHNSCLRSWLEQDTSCPTCRKALSDSVDKNFSYDITQFDHTDILDRDATEHVNSQPRNQFFHFDGSQYVSWLPSFLVEVNHPNVVERRNATSDQSSQFDSMARQVQQMFPHMPLNLIMDDLCSTKSVEVTVENILDGKLVPPPPAFQNGYIQDSNLQASDNSQNSLFMGKPQSISCRGQFDYIEDAVFPPESYDLEELDRFPDLMRMHIASPLGCRFSKSPQEREQILAKRKEDLIKQARRKYLTKSSVH
ncbi:E3 ubiquitin-protein ligase AMFR-like [Uloborus diversus]|uniref:E3 ubiquitin-protein ligase AMFR-like n=1 Tax=Uloborus diversus TaxID=327109 RepID=UPI0024094B3F|nr:E3 ubiquitin-protein ligase AMFR-like [Uloborus diversus]